MSKIKIMVDSPSDLPLDLAKEYDITVMPIKYTIDDITYRDKFDQSEKEFYNLIRTTGKIPVTSQITPLEFEEYFREAAKDCDEIIAIILSSAASGTFRNANMAKEVIEEETNIKIHLFDSKSFSFCYGYLALKAGMMAKEGKTAEEILEKIKYISENYKVAFGVETLDYLKKGGRIKTTTAVIGGILDIRPMLSIKEGLVVATDKVKGEVKFNKKLMELTENAAKEIKNHKIFVLSSDVDEKCEKFKAELKDKGYKVDDRLIPVGAVIGSHAGPGVFGIIVTVE